MRLFSGDHEKKILETWEASLPNKDVDSFFEVVKKT